MSSDVFEQFAEEFGCWVTGHGVEFHGPPPFMPDGPPPKRRPAFVDLDMLESAIRDLITEARAMVAAETLTELDSAAGKLKDMPHYWRITQVLEPVRAELTEIASPDGECPQCGHTSQPEYRHGTTAHVQEGDAVRDLQRRVQFLETTLGPKR